MKNKLFIIGLAIVLLSTCELFDFDKNDKDKVQLSETSVQVGSEATTIEIEGTNTALDGVSIEIPANTFADGTVIEISLGESAIPENASITELSESFDFHIEGMTELPNPITIQIPLSNSEILDTPIIITYDKTTDSYDYLPVVSIENGIATYVTNHFSTHRACKINEPDLPIGPNFSFETDSFPVKNFDPDGGTYGDGSLDGMCYGISFFTNWYFQEKKEEHLRQSGISENVLVDIAEDISWIQLDKKVLDLRKKSDIPDFIAKINNPIKFAFDSMIASLQLNEPIVIRLSNDHTGAYHAVLVYKFANGIFNVFDSNNPTASETLTLNIIDKTFVYSGYGNFNEILVEKNEEKEVFNSISTIFSTNEYVHMLYPPNPNEGEVQANPGDTIRVIFDSLNNVSSYTIFLYQWNGENKEYYYSVKTDDISSGYYDLIIPVDAPNGEYNFEFRDLSENRIDSANLIISESTPTPYNNIKGLWKLAGTSPYKPPFKYIQFTDNMMFDMFGLDPNTDDIYMYGSNPIQSVNETTLSHEWGQEGGVSVWQYSVVGDQLTRSLQNTDGSLEGTVEVYNRSSIDVPIGACFYLDPENNSQLTERYWVNPCSGSGYKIVLPLSVDITSIKPEIHIAQGYSISPNSLTLQDISSPVSYTLTGNGQTKTVTLQAFQATPTKMIVNGDFSLNNCGWSSYDNTSTGLTKEVENGEMHLTISQVGNNPWDAGLVHDFYATLTNGKTYSLSFDAWGSNRIISVGFGENNRDLNDDGNNYSGYFQLNANISVSKQQFTNTFTMNNPTDDAASFVFHLAQDIGDVYLDNIILEDVTGQNNPPETILNTTPPTASANNSVHFSFEGLDDVDDTTDLLYSTYLYGYDTDWTAYNSNTLVSYVLNYGESYTFYVKAMDSNGNEDPTPAEYSFQIEYLPPEPPTDFAVTDIGSDFVELFWTMDPDTVTEFVIKRSLSESGSFEYLGEPGALGNNQYSYRDENVDPETTYYYIIQSWNYALESSYTDVVSATTLSGPQPLPGSPSNVQIMLNQSESAIIVYWDHASDYTYYEIWRSVDESSFTLYATNELTDEFFDDSFQWGLEYSYKIRAVNSTGEGSFSSIVSLQLEPEIPDGFEVATSFSNRIILRWDLSDGADTYRIQYSNDDISYENLAILGENVDTYTHGGLVSGQTFYYKIQAGNSAGWSDYSSTVSGTTP